jgi:hypothetical protein
MRIHIGTSGRTYWFLPWNGGTDDLQHLASTRDVDSADWRPPSPDDGPRPLGDLDYIATDQTYRVLDHVPSRGEQAPAHILLPTLGDALWHRNFAVNDHRDSAPKQFFDLTACSPRS